MGPRRRQETIFTVISEQTMTLLRSKRVLSHLDDWKIRSRTFWLRLRSRYDSVSQKLDDSQAGRNAVTAFVLWCFFGTIA
jgi:hypothetical protein